MPSRAKNTCIVTDFPSKCLKMHPECTDDTRSITFHVVNSAQIWLAIEDVAWAVQYMYDQNLLKGVGAAPPRGHRP